ESAVNVRSSAASSREAVGISRAVVVSDATTVVVPAAGDPLTVRADDAGAFPLGMDTPSTLSPACRITSWRALISWKTTCWLAAAPQSRSTTGRPLTSGAGPKSRQRSLRLCTRKAGLGAACSTGPFGGGTRKVSAPDADATSSVAPPPPSPQAESSAHAPANVNPIDLDGLDISFSPRRPQRPAGTPSA